MEEQSKKEVALNSDTGGVGPKYQNVWRLSFMDGSEKASTVGGSGKGASI